MPKPPSRKPTRSAPRGSEVVADPRHDRRVRRTFSHEDKVRILAESLARHAIPPDALVVHIDRGAPMTSHGFAQLLGTLGVSRSFSRPRVSDDNPFSESAFKTLKYQGDYPGRFDDLGHARAWLDDFFRWYNADHHHHGLALFTPEDVFTGRVNEVAATRQRALDAAFHAHPERFPHGPPRVQRPADVVCAYRLS